MNITRDLVSRETQKFTDEWNGEAFWFEAKTNALTPKLLQQFADIDSRPIEMANALADIITKWSLDNNGEPFPPTAENISILPVAFLTQMIEKMSESWQGNVKPQPQSQNGLAVAAR